MRNLLLLLSIALFTACNSSDKKETASDTGNTDSTAAVVTDDTLIDINDEDTATNDNPDISIDFVVIADTGLDYYALNKKMYDLNKQLRLDVDTMNRYYNKKKNEIILRENDEDKMYAGQYFPRRFPSESLSLEYLDTYQEGAGKKTIALVAGIYENSKSADSALKVLKTADNKSFTLKAAINTGCAH